MDKSLNYLALARKGGRAELGEEPVGAAARAGKAYLVIVASDASDHSWRRAKSYVSGTDQQCIRLKQTKDELGQSIGRTSLAMAALTGLGYTPAEALDALQKIENKNAPVDELLRLALRSMAGF